MSWTQIGQTINGEASSDNFGIAVSMSSNGNAVAIGANYNDGGGSNSGHVRVYYLNNNTWTIRGLDIDGIAANENIGSSVSLNTDGTIVAISGAAKARVYYWSGSSWIKRGTDVDITSNTPTNVSISSDGSVLATSTTSVKVYSWSGSSWVLRTPPSITVPGGTSDVFRISLSSDGNVLLVSRQYANTNKGFVMVYSWNSSTSSWIQKGSTINGTSNGEYFGRAIALRSDGDLFAACFNDDSVSSGGTRVYYWNGSDWSQKGADVRSSINFNSGEGTSVTLTNFKSTELLTIGATNSQYTGRVTNFIWNGASWSQIFNTFSGSSGGSLGYNVNSISMSSNAFRLAVGDPTINSNGAVKIYKYLITTNISATSSYTKTYGDSSFNLNATSNNTETSITYSSNNTAVATVNSSGQVTIVGAGSATISLSQTETTNYSASGEANVSITVNKATPTITATSSYTKTYGDASFNLNATSNNTETSITYSSSNTSVATVNSSGQVNIIGAGLATITLSQTATTNYNSGTASVSITVNKTNPIINVLSSLTKYLSDVSFNLNATSNNNEGSITYSTNDTNISVDQTGQVTIIGDGTATVTLTQLETTNYNLATKIVTINIYSKITTVINATFSYTKTYGDASFNLNATSNNTETSITYSSSNTEVATVNSSGQVTILAAGSATITLSQTETTNYNFGTTSVSITVNKATPTITATSSYTKTYGDASFNLNATSDNTEISITYSSNNTGVATVDSIGQVSIVGVGSATITLSQTETTNYSLGSATVSLVVNKINTSINALSSYTKTYGDASFNLNATSNNTEASITYLSSNTGVATVNSSGQVSIVGSGSATITLSQTATTNYTLGSFSVSITVNKSTPTITATSSHTKTYGDASFNLNATSDNTETSISYSSDNTGVAAVNSTGQVSIVGVGSATITLSQTSTTNYIDASANVTISVNKATPTITAISSYTKTYGDASFNLNATSDNTETSITYSSDTTSVATVNSSGQVTIVGTGSATITLSQTATTNYNLGSKNISITVNKATPTITVTTPIIKVYEDSSFNLNATSNNNETPITYTIDDTNEVQLDSNGQVNIVGSGSSTITVSQIETSNYNAVSEFVSITVNKAITTISATSSHTKTYGDASFNLNATSNNTETSITYSSDTTSVATVNSSGEVTVVGAGLATITLSQTSTTNYSLGTKYVYLTVNKLTTAITSSTSIEKVYGDNSFQLEFTTNNPETTYFESSNTLVATIDSSGNIVLIKPGTTDLTIYQLSSSNYTDASLNITLNVTKTYTAQELRDLGFTVTEMKNAGYTATELKAAEFTATELKAEGFTATELKEAEFTATELKEAEFTATELKAAEFSASELKAADFTASELKNAEFTLAQLYEADFTATQLKVAEFTATQLKDVGYSVAELNFANFTASELKEAGFTATELRNGNYTDSEVLSAGFSGSELRISGYTVSELQTSGYTDEAILSSGFTTAELYISGYNINEIKNTGYTETQILADLNTVLSVIPYPPIITNVQPEDSKLYVSFTDNSNNSFPILGYKYSLNNSTELKWFVTKQSPLTIFGLINGESYSIGMYAVNANGTSVVSNIINNVRPSAVPSKSTIAVATLDNDVINAIFTVGNSNGSPITEYYYSLDQINYSLIEPSGNTFSINNVSPNQSYTLSMKTKNSNGFSEDSNTIIVSNPDLSGSVLPQPVSITSVEPDDLKIHVDFIDNSNNLTTLLGYKYSLNNSTDLKWSLTKQSPLTIFGLTNGESYSVGMYAVNINGDSIVSNIISNIVPSGIPSKPTLVSATRNGQTVAVEFTGANSNGSTITEYYYSLDLTSYTLIEPSGNFLLINNIQYNQNYIITMKTKNVNGFSQISNPININSSTSPDAPVITNIVPGDKECTLYFNPGNTYSSNIICYKYIINNDTSTEYIATNKTSPLIIGYLVNGNAYTFKIKVFTQSGESSLSNESESVVPYGVPLAPLITSLEPRDRAIIVSFTANNNDLPVSGIKYSVNDTNLVDVGMVTSSFTISNLTNKNTSTITIYSYNNIGTSIRSNTMICTPGAPTAPIITSMYVSNTILYINYTPSAFNNGSSVTKMYYTLDAGKNNIPITMPIATISNPLVIPKLQTGVDLNIGIVAQNSNGFSPVSNLQNVVITNIPSKPTILSVTPVYESATTFIANVLLGTILSNGSPITGYKYAIGSTSTTYYDVSGTSMPLSIPGLPVNTSLVLKIRAINGIGQSLESAASKSFRYNINVPAKIVIRTVTTSYELATINFTKPAINGSEISTYKYSLNNSEYVDLNTTTLPLLIPIQNNVSYNIRIIATNIIGDSAPSDSMTKLVSFTYLPPFPPRISSVISWNNSLIVYFMSSVIRGAPVTSVSYAIDSSQNIIDSGSLTSPIIVNNLTNGTKYNVMLFSNSLAGMSGVSNILSGTPILAVPATPVITSITPLNNSCSIIFTPPLANGSTITTYKYTLDNGATILNANTNVLPILISNLVNGTTYSIQILATNSVGDSLFSVAKTVTPIYAVPSAPLIKSVSRTTGRATVNFTLSTPNGSTISSYYYTFDNGSTFISANKITTPITITGLTSGASYSLRLVALNDLGYSQLSNENIFTAI